ncbi:MAG: hypothetical protein AB2810_15935 [Candidatus Thiodiazotropha endolucinida]
MSRKKQTTASDIEQQISQGKQELEIAKEKVIAETKVDAFSSGYTENRDLVNQFIGRNQILNAFNKMTDVTMVMDWKQIKDSKVYQSLSNQIMSCTTQKLVTVTTWADFCNHILGISREHADEQIRNLETFGIDALDSMNNAGLGYRALRRLRKLSEEDQQIIIGEVEANVGDKEAILTLIDDLAIKHNKEKEVLEKKVEDRSRDLEQSRRRVQELTDEKYSLQDELDNRAHLPMDEKVDDLSRRLERSTSQVNAQILGLRVSVQEVYRLEGAPGQLRDACAQAVNRIYTTLEELRADFGLIDLSMKPGDDDWMKSEEVQAFMDKGE